MLQGDPGKQGDPGRDVSFLFSMYYSVLVINNQWEINADVFVLYSLY